MHAKHRNRFKSFEELTRFLNESPRKRSFLSETHPRLECKKATQPFPAEVDESRIFRDAMRDVLPLTRREHSSASRPPEPQSSASRTSAADASEMKRLEALVQSGAGFLVSQTSEYVEGTGYRVPPEIAGRLHRGDFSIQSHIDLHGLGVEAAKENLDRFLKEAIRTGKRHVLVVHGRGLSSPAKPVLKTRICEWLTTGPWRKWVIAFASARLCDGGAGATYVLLRRRPFTRRYKKKPKPLKGGNPFLPFTAMEKEMPSKAP
ncbi:MAG: Smr/MutS family protein [Deltaproteobacteria bacterium]|nr:Smr/MutS family protein [Deltaproteobacteria bacterium]MBW2042819.1 Smr/MutS family protein [Deltaproteobacteria bacterium]MBW2133598.1 Smr/MutS family protein [Deltaproteobacteria bacterium]